MRESIFSAISEYDEVLPYFIFFSIPIFHKNITNLVLIIHA